MNATSAPPGVGYSVHSNQRVASARHNQGQQYHGVGTMSLNYKVVEVSSTDPAYSVGSINADH